MNLSTNVSNLVSSLAKGKMSEAETYFTRAMTEKMNSALDERKIAIASQIYNKPSLESQADKTV